MNKDQFVRYKALDSCFRNVNGTYTIDDLISECEKALAAFHPGEQTLHVSRRTVEKDLSDLQARYTFKFQSGLSLGHKKMYRYEDTSYSLMKELLADGELEQMMLQGVLDTLSLYENVPQYQWLYVFIQERIHGKAADGTKLISFDNNEELVGMENFGRLMNAILRHQPLSLDYKPYGKELKTIIVYPYHLKQFNGRWYLIANTSGFEGVSNYAIDRIKDIKEIDAPFILSDVDIVDYFKNVIGVTRSKEPVENVLIRISNKRYNYVRSKKMHPTQEVVMHLSDKEYTVVKLQVQVNNELEANILSLGCDAVVLAPESLKQRIKQKIEQLYNTYK